MKVGARLYGIDAAGLVETARRAESLGYESLWRGEHVLATHALHESDYPYSADGSAPFSASTSVLDPFGVLNFVAAATSRIKLATGVYLVALRHPILTARQVATLDTLSEGRAILGVGAGWLQDEFKALNVPFERRGARTDEAVRAIHRLLSETVSSYRGRHFSFHDVILEPKPAQKGGVSIVIGGESDAALRRAAEVGDGWYGHAGSIDHCSRRVHRLREMTAVAGRRAQDVEVTVRVAPHVSYEETRALEDVGVDRIVVETGSFDLIDSRDTIPDLERVARSVLQRL